MNKDQNLTDEFSKSLTKNDEELDDEKSEEDDDDKYNDNDESQNW